MGFLAVIFIGGFIIHIALGIYATIRVIKTNQLTNKQKRINILFIFIIPFIWSILMYYMFKKLPESYEIDSKDKFKSDDFHESGIGITTAAYLPN